MRAAYQKGPAAMFVLLVLGGLLTKGRPVAAMQNEPKGFGNVEFGMTPDELKKLYPGVTQSPVPTPAPGEVVPPFTMPRYRLAEQTVGPLQHCTVDFQFFNQGFYQAIVACPGEKEKIEEYLTREYGKAGKTEGLIKSWTGEKTHVSYTAASGVFQMSDVALSQTVAKTVIGFVLRHGGQLARPAARTPAASPGKPETQE